MEAVCDGIEAIVQSLRNQGGASIDHTGTKATRDCEELVGDI